MNWALDPTSNYKVTLASFRKISSRRKHPSGTRTTLNDPSTTSWPSSSCKKARKETQITGRTTSP